MITGFLWGNLSLGREREFPEHLSCPPSTVPRVPAAPRNRYPRVGCCKEARPKLLHSCEKLAHSLPGFGLPPRQRGESSLRPRALQWEGKRLGLQGVRTGQGAAAVGTALPHCLALSSPAADGLQTPFSQWLGDLLLAAGCQAAQSVFSSSLSEGVAKGKQ